ncbi:MAG: hypothetical protein IIA23_06740 [Chloroflexi bacterium]|nr:hypothetical protein [Chloroflexota bacterium]
MRGPEVDDKTIVFGEDRFFAGLINNAGTLPTLRSFSFDGDLLWYSGPQDLDLFTGTFPKLDPSGRVIVGWGQTAIQAITPDGGVGTNRPVVFCTSQDPANRQEAEVIVQFTPGTGTNDATPVWSLADTSIAEFIVPPGPTNGPIVTTLENAVRNVLGEAASGLSRKEAGELFCRNALKAAYVREIQRLIDELKRQNQIILGMAHITGGGILENLPRILPGRGKAVIDRGAWEPPPLFRLIQERGNIAEEEMYRTFNMGLGIVLAVAAADAEAVRSQLPGALVVGEVVRGKGVVWG